MKTKSASLLLVFSLMLFLIGYTSANNDTVLECGYSPNISISPEIPTKDDPITLYAGGIWPNACTPTIQSYNIIDNTIWVDALWNHPPDIVCAQVVLFWGDSIDIGLLPAGVYETELYITRGGAELCYEGSFIVFEQLFQRYLPVIFSQ